MLKKEYEILLPFSEKPWKKFTLKDIMHLAKKKSESYVYNSLKKLEREKILAAENAGNILLYNLNLKERKSCLYAGIAAEHKAWNMKQIPFDALNNIISRMPTSFFVLIITGSYANGKQSKSSDLDAVIICDNCADTKKIYAELSHECEMSIPPVHLFVFKKSEFLGMLHEEKANYGKEITNNNLIVSGGEIYYSIVYEAIKNGFNG